MGCASCDTGDVLANVQAMMDKGIDWASQKFTDEDICAMHLLTAAELGLQIG